jgi:DNA-binding response OmpR family regulator
MFQGDLTGGIMTKGSLLVVDDEPITRQSLTDILRLEGYSVTSVPNGEEAVEHLRRYSVDLVVLDLRMPGMGGMDVMRAVSQISPETEIILLTAHGSMETAVDALRFRVHDYLIKPASPGQILASIERGLSRKALRLAQKKMRTTDSAVVSSMVHFEDGTTLDLSRRIIEWNGKTIHLTPAEGLLLKVLLERPDSVFTHRELVLLIRGHDASLKEAQEILRPLVSRTRKKLENIPALRDSIQSVRGAGYVYSRKTRAQAQ